VHIGRRTFLKMATASCACGLSGFSAHAGNESAQSHAPGADHKSHWSYEGQTGPAHWGELSPDFKVCRLGLEQTPIDLSGSLKADLGSLAIDYHNVPFKVLNNGHTIQSDCSTGCAFSIADTRYDLAQFHFHHPSEHLLDGKAFDMELHLVHKSADGALAVIGVFVASGSHNPALDSIFSRMPASEGAATVADVEIDPSSLLPAARNHFRYAGSLTTPPCSEGLVWTVFRDPIEASPAQIHKFAALFPNNARPVQRKNNRFLIEASP